MADAAAFNAAMPKLVALFQKVGITSLRPGQDQAVMNLMMSRDTFTVLPTGHGKSMIYILPTLALERRALIFSPLISLMQDQVESLWRMGLKAGQLTSAQLPAENVATLAQWKSGELQFLLAAPERIPNPQFREAMQMVRPNLIVLDEAHCILGDIRVSTEKGPVAISEIHRMFQAGEEVPKVLSFNDAGERSFKRVTNTWKQPWKEVLRISVKGGNLYSTGDHKWFTQRGWVEAQELRPLLDSLLGVNCGRRKIRRPNKDQLQLLIGSFLGDG